MVVLSSKQDVRDFIRGTTILATGGGGPPEVGLELLVRAVRAGERLEIAPLEEISQLNTGVSPFFVGSMAYCRALSVDEVASIAKRSMELLEEMGIKPSFIFASEMGGRNAAIPLFVSSILGLPCADGDLIGRAAPEVVHSTTSIYGVSPYPALVVTPSENVFTVRRASIELYEYVVRSISKRLGKSVFVVDTPVSGKTFSKIAVRGTMSKSLELGRAVRQARARGEDPVEALVKALGGWLLFRGIIADCAWSDEGGFLLGEVLVKGVGEWKGMTFKSWIKNEHIMAWVDGRPIVMPPDMFTFVKNDGEPLTNPDLKPGLEVCVVGGKAPEVWRTEKGLELFGPRHFGLDYDYIPIEELVEKRQ